jgi:hypothetical protein
VSKDFKKLGFFREIALMSKGAATDAANPFAEIDEEEEEEEAEASETLETTIPEWLAEIPDDLEVRDFLQLLHRPLLPLLLLGPPFFPNILFLSTTLLTWITGIYLPCNGV